MVLLWALIPTVGLTALFLAVDPPFFLANISKILHGTWFSAGYRGGLIFDDAHLGQRPPNFGGPTA
jgi:K+ transporter